MGKLSVTLIFGITLTLCCSGNSAKAESVPQVAVGYKHACALVSSGLVHCWGFKWVNGSESNSALPQIVKGIGNVKAISAGGPNTCAIDFDDQAWCWGLDWKDSLKTGKEILSGTPKLIEGLPPVVQIAIGYSHVCAIDKIDGGVWCWGQNPAGELGNGTTDALGEPGRVAGVERSNLDRRWCEQYVCGDRRRRCVLLGHGRTGRRGHHRQFQVSRED